MFDKSKLSTYTFVELSAFLADNTVDASGVPTISASDKKEISDAMKALQPKATFNAPKHAKIAFLVNSVITGQDKNLHVAIIGTSRAGSYEGNIKVSPDQQSKASNPVTKDMEGKVVMIDCEITIEGKTEYVDEKDGKVKAHKSTGIRPSSFIERYASPFEEKRLMKDLERSDETAHQLTTLKSKAVAIAALEEEVLGKLKDSGIDLANLF